MSQLQVIRTIEEMQALTTELRGMQKSIAVVPTMGFLHDGHLSLLRAAREHADVVILTIFVNPTQFGPNEDLSRYPRDEAGDIAKAQSAGADYAFCPEAIAMYPHGAQTTVGVGEIAGPLCGARRPGHFAGVATIVAKIFNIVQPTMAFFGEKDFQQLAVIRRMTIDLNFPIAIVGVPIMREADGLAMSSRNVYLQGEQRRTALRLSQSLEAAKAAFAAGERNARVLEAIAEKVLAPGEDLRIDYVEVRDATTLHATETIAAPAVLALATFVGTTRLIDNCVLSEDTIA